LKVNLAEFDLGEGCGVVLEVGPCHVFGLGVGGGEVAVTGWRLLTGVADRTGDEIVDAGYGFSGSTMGDDSSPALCPFV
jgi:hypothetical protein